MNKPKCHFGYFYHFENGKKSSYYFYIDVYYYLALKKRENPVCVLKVKPCGILLVDLKKLY
jgi:hypothetical protein